MNDLISEDATIVTSNVHYECIACGAENLLELEWVNHADKIFVKCQYCGVELVVALNWEERIDI